jgi:hypothetical protein
MFNNIRRYGVEHQRRLYGPMGNKVIDVYVENQSLAARSPVVVIGRMKNRIKELGPAKVSRYCSDTMRVIDVAPSSIADTARFEAALEWVQGSGFGVRRARFGA